MGVVAAPEHPYWAGSHNRPGQTIKVQAITLDTPVQQLALKAQFLLKLDLQCGEVAALRGGRKTLMETDTVICETGNDEFPSVCEFLTNHNFGLIDLTNVGLMPDGILSQLYPVFLNRRLDRIKSTLPWDPKKNVLSLQQWTAQKIQKS